MSNKMFPQKLLVFIVLTLLLCNPSRAEVSWDWQKTPPPQAWAAFFRAGQKGLDKHWQILQRDKLAFESLAWEWRVAFVRACGTSQLRWCGEILQLGLFDRALVVRAEAVSRLGERFAGTAHPATLRLLGKAYAVQQNQRGDRPLFIQYRILHAIRQVGGPEALQLGARLALMTEETSRYWSLLAAR